MESSLPGRPRGRLAPLAGTMRSPMHSVGSKLCTASNAEAVADTNSRRSTVREVRREGDAMEVIRSFNAFMMLNEEPRSRRGLLANAAGPPGSVWNDDSQVSQTADDGTAGYFCLSVGHLRHWANQIGSRLGQGGALRRTETSRNASVAQAVDSNRATIGRAGTQDATPDNRPWPNSLPGTTSLPGF